MTEILGIIAIVLWIIGIFVWYQWYAKKMEKEFEESKKTAVRKDKVH